MLWHAWTIASALDAPDLKNHVAFGLATETKACRDSWNITSTVWICLNYGWRTPAIPSLAGIIFRFLGISGISTACSAGLVGYWSYCFCTHVVVSVFFRLFDGFVNYLQQCWLHSDYSNFARVFKSFRFSNSFPSLYPPRIVMKWPFTGPPHHHCARLGRDVTQTGGPHCRVCAHGQGT
jgi:hypothetical protein